MSEQTYIAGADPAIERQALALRHPMLVRVSWGAIFGGVFLAVAIQILLSALGAGIGLGTVNVNAGSTPSASSLGMGAGAWWVISSCIALFVAGYVTSWMAGTEWRFDGLLHGVITWAIATVLTIYLLSSAIGGVVGGGFSALSSVVSAAGSGISDAAKPLAQAAGVTPDVIEDQVKAYLQPANPDVATMSPQDAQKEFAMDLASYARGGADADALKGRMIDIMAAQMKISRDDAAKRFDETQAKVVQARDKAIQTAKTAADNTASAASKTSFLAFGMLALGLIVAAIGGSLAARRRIQPRLI